MVDTLKQIWLSIRSNRIFVAFEGGASGAALNFIYDACTTGHLDFSPTGRGKFIVAVIAGGIAAVRGLNRPAPGSTPNQ